MANASPKTAGIKICGLTRPDEAAACADLGADAIGLIFHPPSPRHLDDATAATVTDALPENVARIGVFVNTPVETILEKVRRCGLTGVQLHGNEPPEAVWRLRAAGLMVIKALFAARAPGLEAASNYAPDAFLVECGRGRLPGGNAEVWHWAEARGISAAVPLVLAGGLNPENVAQAIAAAAPDAVDVSSGVEKAPGRKDLSRVAAFIQAVRAAEASRGRLVFPR
ncbi:MAG: phosphoribosylanthranilate isomerase [Desulfobacterales bacterium]|jgi:phosphoribosylanthranilate isomerase|nr:phosphoribosylanthranilate isomerase [Desulfobacteraceae bacterium]MDY0312693.1 phosphoribosylanthranilate isomerase [Desulfobacterales bacterium]